MSILPVILVLLAQAAEPRPERVILTGTVVTPDGKPAAGAGVVLVAVAVPPNPEVRRNVAALRPPAVLATRRAEADGRFQIELPERVEVRQYARRPPVFLWAFGPGGALTMRPIPHDWPPDGIPVRLALAAPEPVRFLVLDPDERPVAGARLAPAWIRGMNLPDELGDRLAVQTDARGRATLDLGAVDEVEVVRVVSGPSGVQQLRMPGPDASGVRTLRLMPVGRVEGRIQAGDPQAVRGLTVRGRTVPDPAADVVGFASVVTDDQGRFTIPAIAAGTLVLSFEHRWDLPWRGSPASRPQVQPGTTTEVSIPLQRAALVKGVIQEDPSGRPIAGAGVYFHRDLGDRLARSDAEGRFSDYLVPGRVFTNPVELPRGYYNPSTTGDPQSLPEGTAELTLKPIEVRRGAELQGRILDAEGKPVPGAGVSGHLELAQETYGGFVGAVTDRQGRFRITGLPPNATVQLAATCGEATTAAPVSIPSSKETIDLTIRPENAVALFGRVKDPAGRPVAGAAVRVSARKRGSRDIPIEWFTVAYDDEGRSVVRTGADGQFRTPRQLRPDMEYQVDVEADGYAPAATEWNKLDDRKLWYMPALTLQPATTTRTVAGRVVDSAGRPVAGAVVFQAGDGPALTRTTTGPDGRFRLPGIYREPAFLFVEADGLAFEGHRIGAGDEAVELKARRVGEPAAGPPLHTLPPVLPREEEKALARRMIGTDLTLLTGETTRESYPLAHALPRVDFDRAWDLVENRAVADPFMKEALRLGCADVLAATNLEEAAAVAEAALQPSARSGFYCRASDSLPKADRARKLDLLDKALRHARADPRPGEKLAALGRIGIRLLEAGEIERGTQVLREGQHLADTLPKVARRQGAIPHPSRGRFASKLARIDARAALELAEGFADIEGTLYKSDVALALADRDPAVSEQVFGGLKRQELRDPMLILAVGRMAGIDRDRARRLVEMAGQPRGQALALGAMAQALADTDRKEASALIDEAFRRLEKLPRTVLPRLKMLACVADGHLLPTAEKLDPELLRRGFWLAVALRPDRPAGGDPAGSYEEGIADLAIALARYDRAVARQVLEPAAGRARALIERSTLTRGHDLFIAAAMIDPAWAVTLVDALPDDTPGRPLHPKATIRRLIAEMLAYDGPERWDYYLGRKVAH